MDSASYHKVIFTMIAKNKKGKRPIISEESKDN